MDNNKRIYISATIVLYKEDEITLKKTIDSFLAISTVKKLFLVDNSPTDKLRNLSKHDEVEYVFVEKNIGFGAGHNKILDKIKNYSDFHLVLNPDVSFNGDIITKLVGQLDKEDKVAMIAPKVIFPDERHQYTARKYPKFMDLIIRRLNILGERIHENEYRNKDLSKPMFVEYLTGCFQLYKTADFVAINGFDERYFLYMEDVDICKKIDVLGKKKMYYPHVSITHVLKQGSSKNLKLFYYHLSSAIKYFLKWC